MQPTKIDKEGERKVAQKKLEVDPERVSSKSTVRSAFEPSPETSESSQEGEEDLLKGVKNDMVSQHLHTKLDAPTRQTPARQPSYPIN